MSFGRDITVIRQQQLPIRHSAVVRSKPAEEQVASDNYLARAAIAEAAGQLRLAAHLFAMACAHAA